MNFPIETGIASLSQQQLLDYVERDAWPIRVKTGAIQSSVNNISVKNTIVRGGLRSDCSANSRRLRRSYIDWPDHCKYVQFVDLDIAFKRGQSEPEFC